MAAARRMAMRGCEAAGSFAPCRLAGGGRRSVGARDGWPLLGLGLAIVLAGCVSAPRRPTEQIPWPAQRARVQALAAYELTGRVAVAAGGDGFSANLQWTQHGGRSTLLLSGPFGIGGMHVVADHGMLDVKTSKGQRLTSDEARAELEGKLGFDPPLASLRYWLVGAPDPAGKAIETVGLDQRLAALVQDGWHIAYSGYLEAGGYALPRHISMRRAGVRVKVVVDRWRPRAG